MKKFCKHCKKELVDMRRGFCDSKCREEYYMKICPQCGKRFKPTNGPNQKCCSVKCHAKSRMKEKITKICPVCKKTFKVNPSCKDRIYCSRKCDGISKSKKIKKICPTCGKEFTVAPWNKNRIHCTLKCSLRKVIEKICPVCGKTFKVKEYYSNRKYCSKECKYKGWKGRTSWKKGMGNIKVELVCLECGITFIALERYNRKFCSNKCVGRYMKGRKRPLSFGRKIRLSRIKKIENRYGQMCPNYSPKACNYFNTLNKKYNWNIQHAENGGEFHIKEVGYWLDGYESNLNIAFEYDEKFHSKKIEKYIRRQREITNFLDCDFIRIRDSDKQWFNYRSLI